MSAEPFSRNAPCPCDSGRKFKKCCMPALDDGETPAGWVCPCCGRAVIVLPEQDGAGRWEWECSNEDCTEHGVFKGGKPLSTHGNAVI